ncbi:hypothetical protein QZH41_012695 [Actinostola sp. cb2023]|nr:hypothetical protein QZH41_012695 [Actinostola sp. cb2023]
MAAKMTKMLWSTSLRLRSPFLSVIFKRCHLETTRRVPRILSSIQVSSLSSVAFGKVESLDAKQQEHPSPTANPLETESPTRSKMPDLSKIITESDDTYKIPKAADSHRSQSVFDDELSKKKNSKEPESVEVDPTAIFHQAVENVKPVVGCIPLRKAGRVYQVPSPLQPTRRQFFAIKWIVDAARKPTASKNARMHEKLAKELLDAYNNEGAAIRKKQDLHKTADANRAFAHYRWW